MTAKWLSIIGIGEDGLDGLTPAARAIVDNAEVFVGGARHLAMVPEDGRERLAWPSPIRTLLPEIEKRRGRRVCVLATGDPLYYGVGTTILRGVDMDEVTIVPGRSAFTMATARLGWTRHEVECLTLHGRAFSIFNAYVQPGAKLLILTDDGSTPAKIADALCVLGYGESRITVFERMDSASEGIVQSTAADWRGAKTDDFNTVAVECIAGSDASSRSQTPGLPDEAYANDGQLTKREVRAITLAALCPTPGAMLWDVGAGCGSVAIEWMRMHPRNEAVAIEHNPDRVQMIAANAETLGTPRLQIITGTAPTAFGEASAPDAIFIGGGLSDEGLIESSWTALRSGGRLVANVVTVEGERRLMDWRDAHGGELSRISVERAEPVGRFTGWRPAMTVTQYSSIKT